MKPHTPELPLLPPVAQDESTLAVVDGGKPEPAADVPYEILNTAEDRLHYLRLTDNLIREMVEDETEVAVFLDKSARPVAWMVHALWNQLAPFKPDGTQYEEPEIKFLNIDREQWGDTVGRSEDSMVNVSAIPEEQINELRQVLSSESTDKLQEDTRPDPEKSYLTGKKVMVIDEVRVSGDTLHIADRILRRAFPEAAEIVPVAWMEGQARIDPQSGQRRNVNNPIWYSKTKVAGRGVNDRSEARALKQHSRRSIIGRYWLSTTFETPDEEGMQLRREISQMARDLKQHRLLYQPAPGWKRDIDSLGERIERINGMSVGEYKELRRVSKNSEDLLRRLGRLAHADSDTSSD